MTEKVHSAAPQADALRGSNAKSAPSGEAVRFTPGPWRMWTSNSFRRISSDATGGDGDVLCAVTQASDGHPDLHFKNGGFEGPDATLILAAPDLYEALTDVLRIAKAASIGVTGNAKRIARAEAALAKARGE